MRRTAAWVLAAVLVTGCDQVAGGRGDAAPPPRPSTTTSPTPTPPPTPAPSPRETREAPPAPTSPAPPHREPRFRPQAAMATVRALAGRIGPREATSPAYRRAARLVEDRLRDLGYQVSRQRLRVPAGVSWGVPVDAGATWNVVARPPRFRPRRPHVLVGAHLDTVPQAPGAEDNASGVALLLELARLAANHPTRGPVVFVAFGAEEPRGEGDDLHHFGSQAYVARLSAAERAALRAMVSLDRVGVGRVVPICTGGLSPPRVRDRLARAGARVGVPVDLCADNQSSDHWSFEKAGVVAARLGSTPYVAYHSTADLPRVVRPAQLARTGHLAWEWLRAAG